LVAAAWGAGACTTHLLLLLHLLLITEVVVAVFGAVSSFQLSINLSLSKAHDQSSRRTEQGARGGKESHESE
jgi:hypothetical protein